MITDTAFDELTSGAAVSRKAGSCTHAPTTHSLDAPKGKALEELLQPTNL